MVLYLVVWVISILVCIVITRLAFEIPKFSKRVDDIVDVNSINNVLMRKQNDILMLLLHASFENKKIGLINKTNSSVKIIDISELNDYDLSLYNVEVLAK